MRDWLCPDPAFGCPQLFAPPETGVSPARLPANKLQLAEKHLKRIRATRQNAHMPNIANVFKVEITRLARKELRANNDGLKKGVAAQRAEIAGLKRKVQDLEATLKRLEKGAGTKGVRLQPQVQDTPVESSATGLRFRASGLAANRKRLGLSAADFGLLVGATGQSIYAWEAGKAKPRPQALAAIAELRGVGKREVDARLEKLKA